MCHNAENSQECTLIRVIRLIGVEYFSLPNMSLSNALGDVKHLWKVAVGKNSFLRLELYIEKKRANVSVSSLISDPFSL